MTIIPALWSRARKIRNSVILGFEGSTVLKQNKQTGRKEKENLAEKMSLFRKSRGIAILRPMPLSDLSHV